MAKSSSHKGTASSIGALSKAERKVPSEGANRSKTGTSVDMQPKVTKGRSVYSMEILVQEEFKDGRIESIELLDGLDKEMRVGSLGSVTRGETKMRRYHIEFPERPPSDLKLRLPLITNLKEITVPFRVDGLQVSD